VLDFMLRAAPVPLAPIAAALREGGAEESATSSAGVAVSAADRADPAARLRRLATGCGVRSLRELGVGEEELPVIARLAARRRELASTPGSPGEADCLALLRAAW
jgi:alcohol dehydrogenase class IV